MSHRLVGKVVRDFVCFSNFCLLARASERRLLLPVKHGPLFQPRETAQTLPITENDSHFLFHGAEEKRREGEGEESSAQVGE